MWLKYGIALAAAVIGFIRSWRLFERERMRSPSGGAQLSWDEEPLVPWHIGWTSRSLVALHGSSVIVLGILFLLEMTAHQGSQTLFLLYLPPHSLAAELSQYYLWTDVIATLGFGCVSFLCGSLLAYPFARRFVRPIHVAILSNGVASGMHQWEWSYFSHFSADPRARFIQLYSNRIPDIVFMVSRPPNADIFSQAVALLDQHLSAIPSHPPVTWFRRRSVRVAVQLLAVTIPSVLIGLAIAAFGFTWGWMYYTFVTPLVAFFGGKLFMQMV